MGGGGADYVQQGRCTKGFAVKAIKNSARVQHASKLVEISQVKILLRAWLFITFAVFCFGTNVEVKGTGERCEQQNISDATFDRKWKCRYAVCDSGTLPLVMVYDETNENCKGWRCPHGHWPPAVGSNSFTKNLTGKRIRLRHYYF